MSCSNLAGAKTVCTCIFLKVFSGTTLGVWDSGRKREGGRGKADGKGKSRKGRF